MSSAQASSSLGKLISYVDEEGLFLRFWRKGGGGYQANQDLGEQNRIRSILQKPLTELLAAMLFIKEYGTDSLRKIASFEGESGGVIQGGTLFLRRLVGKESHKAQIKRRQEETASLVRKVFSAYREILERGLQRISFFQTDDNNVPFSSALVSSFTYLEQGTLCSFFNENSLYLLPPMLQWVVFSKRREVFATGAESRIKASIKKRREILFTFLKATASQKSQEEEEKNETSPGEVLLDSEDEAEPSACDPPEKPWDIGTNTRTSSQSRFSGESSEQVLIPEVVDQVCYEIGPISFAKVCREWEGRDPSDGVGLYTILMEETGKFLKGKFFLRSLPGPLQERLTPPDFSQEGAEKAFENTERFRSLLLFFLFPQESIKKLIEGFLGKYDRKQEEAPLIQGIKKIILDEGISLDLFFQEPGLKEELIEVKFWIDAFKILEHLIDTRRRIGIQSTETQDNLFQMILVRDIRFIMPESFYDGKELFGGYPEIVKKMEVLYEKCPEKRGEVFPLFVRLVTIRSFQEENFLLFTRSHSGESPEIEIEDLANLFLKKALKEEKFWTDTFKAFEGIRGTSLFGGTFSTYRKSLVTLLLNREEAISTWSGGYFIIIAFLQKLARSMKKKQNSEFFDQVSFTIFNIFCSLDEEKRESYIRVLNFLRENHPSKEIVVNFLRKNPKPPEGKLSEIGITLGKVGTFYDSIWAEVPSLFPERHSLSGRERALFSPPKSWEELFLLEMNVGGEDIFRWFLQIFQEKVGSWVDPSLFSILGDFLCKKVTRETIKGVFSFLEELKRRDIIPEITEQAFLGVYKAFLEGDPLERKEGNWKFVEKLSKGYGFLSPVFSLNLLRYLPCNPELVSTLEEYIGKTKEIFRLYRERILFFERKEIQALEEKIIELIRNTRICSVWVKGHREEENPRIQMLSPSEYETLKTDSSLDWQASEKEEDQTVFTISEEAFQQILTRREEVEENAKENLILELRSFFFRVQLSYNPQSIEDMFTIQGWKEKKPQFEAEHISTHKGHFFPAYEGSKVEVFTEWEEVEEVGGRNFLRLRVALQNIQTGEVQNVYNNLAISPEAMRPYLGGFLRKMAKPLLKISYEEAIEEQDSGRDLLPLYPPAKRLYELYERGLYLENGALLQEWSEFLQKNRGEYTGELRGLIRALSCHKRQEAVERLAKIEPLREQNKPLFTETESYLNPQGISEEEKEKLFEAQELFSTVLIGNFSEVGKQREALLANTKKLLSYPTKEKLQKEARAVLDFLISIREETRRAYVEVGKFLVVPEEHPLEEKNREERETVFHKAAKGSHYKCADEPLSLLPSGKISSKEILKGFSSPSFEEAEIKILRRLFFIEKKEPTPFLKNLLYYSVLSKSFSSKGKKTGLSLGGSLKSLLSPKGTTPKKGESVAELPLSFTVTFLEETRVLVLLAVRSPFTEKTISQEVVYKKSDSDGAFLRKLQFQSLSLLAKVYEGVAF